MHELEGLTMTEQELERVFGIAAGYFAVMSDPVRLKILHAICYDEKPVSRIVAEVGGSRAEVIRHLGVMRDSGLIVGRTGPDEDAFSVADPTMLELCRKLCMHLGERASCAEPLSAALDTRVGTV